MKIEERHCLTQGKFKTFCKEASKWLTILGLSDWEVTFQFDDIDNNEFLDEEAWISYNMKGRRATIALCVWQSKELSDREVKLAAFHEVIHLLLARISIMAKNDHIDDFDIDEENHAIICRLSYAVYDSKSPLNK